MYIVILQLQYNTIQYNTISLFPPYLKIACNNFIFYKRYGIKETEQKNNNTLGMQIVNCSGLRYKFGYVQQSYTIYNKDLLVYEYVLIPSWVTNDAILSINNYLLSLRFDKLLLWCSTRTMLYRLTWSRLSIVQSYDNTFPRLLLPPHSC